MSDFSTFREVARIAAHTNVVTKIRFSPCGRRFVSASLDGTAKIFDCSRGDGGAPTLLHTLTGHRGTFIADVAWSPCGTKIATADYEDDVVVVSDALMGIALQRWRAHDEGVDCVCFSPDSTRLVTGGANDGFVRVWDVTTRRQICEANTEGDYVSGAAFLAGADEVVCRCSGFLGGQLLVCSASDGSLLRVLARDGLNAFAVSPSGAEIVGRGHDGRIKILSTADGSELRQLAALDSDNWARALAWSSDGRFLLVGISYDCFVVADAASGRQLTTVTTSGHRMDAVDISPDGQRIAVGDAEGQIVIFRRN